MKKFLYIFLTYFISSNAFANQPKDWQLGFQEAASSTMRDIVNFHDLAEGVAEVKLFIDARANYQILPFSLNGYFGYILAMGVLLSAGAGGVIARAQWGFKTLGVYMVMHAALFVNFQEINPKLLVLILQIIMLFTLYYLMPPVKLLETEQSDS